LWCLVDVECQKLKIIRRQQSFVVMIGAALIELWCKWGRLFRAS
jgi:hypothetical protein